MTAVQFYELLRGIALKNHAFLLDVFLDLCGVGNGDSGERSTDESRRSIGVDARCVQDETVAA